MTWEQLVASIAGASAGTLSGFFGVGGNVILIPLLSLGLGLSQHEAQGLTLAALLPPLGLPAVLQYVRAGVRLSAKVVAMAVVGFLAGIPLGSIAANALPASTLRLVFAGLLLVTAVRQIRSTRTTAVEPPIVTEWPTARLLRVTLTGAAGGFASGLLGIGGAIVMIPFFRRVGMTQRQAQATSLAMMLPPIGLPGVLVYAHSQPTMPWSLLLSIAVGFLGGSVLGAKLTQAVSPARLERGFGGLIFLAATLLVMQALRG